MGVDAWALLVAIVAGLWSMFVWFAARKEARDARVDADRALAAAETSALEAARSSDAAERSARALEQQVELAKPPAVAFEVVQVRQARWALINRGTDRATGVTVSDQTTGLITDAPSNATLEPGQSADFLMMGTLGSRIPSSLRVSCDQLSRPVFIDVPPPE